MVNVQYGRADSLQESIRLYECNGDKRNRKILI